MTEAGGGWYPGRRVALNARLQWLADTHAPHAVVAAADGWNAVIPDDDALAELLALKLVNESLGSPAACAARTRGPGLRPVSHPISRLSICGHSGARSPQLSAG